MRQHEAQYLRQDEAIKRMPLPEGRMRQQESGGVKPKEPVKVQTPAFRVPQKQPHSAAAQRNASDAGRRGAQPPVAVDRAYDPAMNPFYDPAKNPFGEAEEDDAAPGSSKAPLSGSLAKEATTLNPFGECDEVDEQKPLDSNLNPFE